MIEILVSHQPLPSTNDSKATAFILGRRNRLHKALDELNAAVAAGSIMKSRHAEINGTFGRAVSDAVREISNHAFLADMGLCDFPHMGLIPGQIKKIEKLIADGKAGFLPELLRLYKDVEPVSKALQSLKGKWATRAAKKDQKPSYVPGRAAQAILDEIEQKLTAQVSEVLEAYKAANVEYLTAQVERWITKTWPSHRVPKLLSMLTKDRTRATNGDYAKGTYPEYRHILVEDYKAKIVKLVTEEAEFTRRVFVSRNSAKLGKIIEAKGNFESVEAFRPRVTRGVIETVMNLKFTDGSSFQVQNQVVYKTSTLGNPFTQYPTTFHNVVMPNGAAMKGPSEQRMNKVFAGRG